MIDETIEMEPSGRVLPIFRGEYDAGRTYENPDIVLYRNSSYVAKKTTVGNPPPVDALANDYWQMVAKGIIDADVSDATVALTYESEEREALQSGETSNTLFSKIKRWYSDFATVVFTGKYSDLTGTPDLKVVATSGNYNDLSNKPTALPASDVPTWAKQATKPTYSKTDVGLGNVNNTSDQNKPVSTAQQTALDKKVNFTDIIQSTAVNIAGKKALDAIEKNPSVAGTLANQLQQVNSNLDNWFPFHSHLKLDDSVNLGLTHFFKNSNTEVDYGTVIQDWYDDGLHINFEIRRDGIYANKIDKDGNSISQRTICTF